MDLCFQYSGCQKVWGFAGDLRFAHCLCCAGEPYFTINSLQTLCTYFQIKEDAPVNARICFDKKLPGTDGRIAVE